MQKITELGPNRRGSVLPLEIKRHADLIRRYDLVHAGAGENGQDIARPAEFLLDSSGTVRWVNLTENYWVRARPKQILEVAKALR